MLLLAHGSLNASAQSTENSETPTGKWLVQCNNQQNFEKLSCQMNQTQRMAKTGVRLLSVTILENASGGTDMVLSLPHGVALQDGVNYKIDSGAKRSGNITVADANGSYSKIPLTADDIANMRKGTSLEVSAFVEGSNGIAFNVDLTGFARAYDLMKKAGSL
ncbi:MAG: invasion associated locus B family protein [Nitratireductor sp.]|nr:invasion associated locus B family protein [Nitratireductor sp.]MCC0019657.1 invasion associated locus B family protein [Nitratireductor sp.]